MSQHTTMSFCVAAVAIMVTMLLSNVGFSTATTPPSRLTNTSDTDRIQLTLPDENRGLSYRIVNVTTNCTLYAPDKELAEVISGHLASGVNLIKYNIKLPEEEMVIRQRRSSLVYKPLYWVRNPGRIGNGLLLLRPEYDILSLMTLELQVVSMDVKINTSPLGCLGALNLEEGEKLLRTLVMNDFRNTSSESPAAMKPNDRVCNIHATNASGIVEFRYLCCHRDEHRFIYCSYLNKDVWINVLFASIMVIKILVMLFSPRFIPDSLYRLRSQAVTYRHKCQEDVEIKMLLTKQPKKVKSSTTHNTFPLSQFRSMDSFKRQIKGLSENTPYIMKLKIIRMSVDKENLLSGDNAPVGIAKTFNNAFIQCQISERDSLADCCKANMLSVLPIRSECTFYTFSREAMKVLLLLLLAVPWILRVIAYYSYEHNEITMRKEAASQRGLKFYFPGNFILLLTPIHVIFIATYVIMSIQMCMFGVFSRFASNTSVHLKFVIRKCFRDMRELDSTQVGSWAIKLMLVPCTKYGLLGLLVGVFLWPLGLPIVVVIWCFYAFPTVNITIRLLYSMFVFLCPRVGKLRMCTKLKTFLNYSQLKQPGGQNKETKAAEKEVRKHPIYQFFVIFFCIISMYSIILLLVELVSFITEIFIYTAMGLILNADTIMTYLSLLLLLGLYGHEVFGYVTNTFLAFNKKMHAVILGLATEKVEDAIYTKDDKQNDVVFRVKTGKCSDLARPITLSKSIDGRPSWKVARLLLFLDKSDEPYIPRMFYNKACLMDYYAAPGELLNSYIRAAKEFGAILLFLVFVMFVVLAFGDSYKISATNKLLATVLGGFVPLLLRKVVFKSHAVPDFDASSIHFQVSLTDLIDPYEETWPIADIEPDSITPLDNFDGEYDLIINTKNEEIQEFSERVQLV